MAKFAATCGWTTTIARDIEVTVERINQSILSEKELPEDIRQAVKKAQELLQRARVQLRDASRAMIEAVAEDLSRKEGRR